MKPIILIGFMGSGKTTLGKQLSRALNIDFIDTDHLLEKEQNMSISAIFDTYGEHYFRELETKLIQDLPKNNCVISLGGGMPCFHNNMEQLNQLGTTIFLSVGTSTLAERLRNGKKTRPLIQSKSDTEIHNFIEKTYSERIPFYQKSCIQLEEKECTVERILTICQAI